MKKDLFNTYIYVNKFKKKYLFIPLLKNKTIANTISRALNIKSTDYILLQK